MANIAAVECSNQLRASLGLATYTATVAPVKLRLMTANGTATTPGTEVSGGSYPAGGLSLTAVLGTESGGSVTNTSALTFTGMPACTVVGVEIWDSAATPVRKWFGVIPSRTVNAGDPMSFAPGSVTISTG